MWTSGWFFWPLNMQQSPASVLGLQAWTTTPSSSFTTEWGNKAEYKQFQVMCGMATLDCVDFLMLKSSVASLTFSSCWSGAIVFHFQQGYLCTSVSLLAVICPSSPPPGSCKACHLTLSRDRQCTWITIQVQNVYKARLHLGDREAHISFAHWAHKAGVRLGFSIFKSWLLKTTVCSCLR